MAFTHKRDAHTRHAAAATLPTSPGANGDGGPISPIQLVTLDLPLTAYLPTDYIPDDTLRLRVYQKLSQAETTQDIMYLRQELRDRFGPIPEPAEHLLLWLQLKALALRAGVASIGTGEFEITVRLPAHRTLNRAVLQQQFNEEVVRVGPQFVRVNRRAAGAQWPDLLKAILEAVGKAIA